MTTDDTTNDRRTALSDTTSDSRHEQAVPSDVAYVAACALGHAFSEHHGPDAVADLLRTADGRPETLDAAREALPAYPSGDEPVIQAATSLLDAAATASRDYTSPN